MTAQGGRAATPGTGSAGRAARTTQDAATEGAVFLEDGEINVRRFSVGPEREVAYVWWNRQTVFEVRREPSNHRVVVAEISEARWKAHILIATVACLGLLSGFVLSGGLSVGWALVLALVFALTIYALLSFEHRVLGATREMGMIVSMDAVVWEGMKATVLEELETLPSRELRRYVRAVIAHRRRHRRLVAAAKKSGTQPPMYEPLLKEEWVSEKKHRVSLGDLVSRMHARLSLESQRGYHRRLGRYYRANPGKVQALGWGVRGCECVACEVAEEQNLPVELSGVEVAREYIASRLQAGPADRSLGTRLRQRRERFRKEQAARELERREQKLLTKREKEKEALRRQRAEEYVAKVRRQQREQARGDRDE